MVRDDAQDLEYGLRRLGFDVRVDENPTDHLNIRIQSFWPLWISWLWRRRG
jgi:hypothetical protein